MAKQTINVGAAANDKTGDPIRTAFTKVNSNFTELYNQLPTSSGVQGYSGGVDAGSAVTLPSDKKVYVLDEGFYTMGDGTEGQVAYFVPANGVTMGWTPQIKLVNARYNNGGTSTKTTDFWWAPFYRAEGDQYQNTLVIAVFAAGAWNIGGGQQD